MSLQFSIDILKRVSRSSIGLHITDDGKIEVRAPHFVPLFIINRFVQSKRAWIIRAKKLVLAKSKIQNIVYREGSVIRIASNSYVIHVTDGNAIVLVGSRMFFPKKFLPRAKFYMEIWCRIFAKKFLTQRLDMYAPQMHVQYKKISIRDTSTRWGSCSSRGTLSFSYRLMFADISIIDYVVIHELAHITHPHHRKIFWDHVEKFYPEYNRARAWLRKEGHTLKI
jgi:hypothetical protein